MSPFLLVMSSAVFLKQCSKELIQCKKRKQTKHSNWSMIKETQRWPIKSFAFKSSHDHASSNSGRVTEYTL